MEITHFEFLREIRTSSSEVYSIYTNGSDELEGRVDIHFLANGKVSALISLFDEKTDEEVITLIEALDDFVINTANLSDNNLEIEVYFVSKQSYYGAGQN